MAGDSLCKWSDAELANALVASTSWRGLMRALGLPETSPQTILRIKRDVARLGLDTSHFITPRAWSDDQLKRAIATAQSQDELLYSLGMQSGSDEEWTRVKANAVRLGLDLSQVERAARQPISDRTLKISAKPQHRWLHAGSRYADSTPPSPSSQPSMTCWYRTLMELSVFKSKQLHTEVRMAG